MVEKIRGKTFIPVEPQLKPTRGPASPSFKALLDQELKEGVRFSAHAQARLRSRGLELSQDQLKQLNQAVAKAAAKGARESLVLVGELAFIVSVPNRTVITAMAEPRKEGGVFTNIDSAVIT
ncbi:MAG: TIGR02530 family flagellar biosynthesis protein [Limnochordia bacterium]|nr:hypothetical protein [Bacillota bacterium]